MNTITLKRVSKTYLKKRSFLGKAYASIDALTTVDLNFDESQVYGLVGESGSGKSTLARLLVGLEKPDLGWILFNGKDMFGKRLKVRKQERGQYQMVFQNPYQSLSPRFSIFEILYEGLKNRGVSKTEARKKIDALLMESALPSDVLAKYPHQLSGGERQRIAVIRALLMEPKLLVLDEPTSSLDVSVRKQILDLIRSLIQKRKMIVLLISHDLNSIRQLAQFVYVMRNGFVVEEGHVDEIYASPKHSYTKQLLWSASYFESQNSKDL